MVLRINRNNHCPRIFFQLVSTGFSTNNSFFFPKTLKGVVLAVRAMLAVRAVVAVMVAKAGGDDGGGSYGCG